MKKYWIVIIILALMISVVGCGAESGGKRTDLDYDKMIDSFVSSALNTFTLKIGDEHSPNAAVWLKSGDSEGTAYSSDEKVITVSEYGKVTAVGEGTAYVVITGVGDMFEVYRYDVSNSGKSASIDYDKMIDSFVADSLNTFSLKIGEEHSPTSAVWLKNGSGNGTAYSSDEKVVTVSEYGKVTAVGEGSAYVVITGLGDMFSVYRYDVSDSGASASIDYDKMIDSFVSSALNTFTLKIGDEHSPNAAVWLKSGSGTAYSSDEKVVTVSEYGKVTAVGEGTAYVVITGVGDMFEVYRYDVKSE